MIPDIRLIIGFCQDELENSRCSVEYGFPSQPVPYRNGRGLPNHAKHDMGFTLRNK